MKKRILSIITTCLVIGVITFLSSYYILRPNISNLKKLNNTKEFTQKEVAEMLGISQSYISRIEKKVISKLQNILNV